MTHSLRIPSISILSIITTVALFSLMASLVANDNTTFLPTRDIIIIPTIEDLTPEPTREIERVIKPVDIDKPDQPPIDRLPTGDPGIYALPAGPIAVIYDGGTLGPNLGAGSDGDFLPLVVVQPTYPRRAAEAGIEGYAIVELTVTATGSVENVMVIESSSSVFNSSAVKAALKFKYKPRVKDGIALDVKGVRYQFTFNLEN